MLGSCLPALVRLPTIYNLRYHRGLIFAVAVVLYLGVAALTNRELSLSVIDLGEATTGASLAALIVFFALPRVLYRGHAISFIVLCVLGVVLVGAFNEYVLDPIVFAADDRRLSISRWGFIDAMVSSFSIAAIVALFDNVDYERRFRHLEALRTEAELAALKHQLNPHIVLNALNNIYALTLERDERAPELVLKLASILRYSLYEADSGIATLEREVELLKAYVDLQALGLGDRANLKFSIDGVVDDRRIVPLLLLPLVENACKHGAAVSQEQPLQIGFKLQIADDTIHFDSTNPFVDDAPPVEASGIGLENLRERLRLAYPERHHLLIDRRAGQFLVSLTLRGEPA